MSLNYITERYIIEKANYEFDKDQPQLGRGANKGVYRAHKKGTSDEKSYAVYCCARTTDKIPEKQLFGILPSYVKKAIDIKNLFDKFSTNPQNHYFEYLGIPNAYEKVVLDESSKIELFNRNICYIKGKQNVNFFESLVKDFKKC